MGVIIMFNFKLLFLGPPSAPLNPSISPQSLSSVVLSWTPHDADCVVKYTIILINITEGNTIYPYITTTNTTSMTVSDLTQGAKYSFIVVGIDGEGRMGEDSIVSEMFALEGKELYREKVSVKLDFKLGMEVKKVQKQGRDERTQEDYRTSAKIHSRCRVVFLRSFSSTLFLYFFQLHP